MNHRITNGFMASSILILCITSIAYPFDKQSNIIASDMNEFHINGIAFAQTDITGVDNSTNSSTIPQDTLTDPYANPQDNFTDPSTMPQNNFTDPSTIPQDTPTDPYANPQDNLTNTQNQKSNAVPEFGQIAALILVIATISIIAISKVKLKTSY